MNTARSPMLTLAFATGLLVALIGMALPTQALADEIVYRDAKTCEEKKVHAHEIASETWTEVKYRDKARGAEISVPTALVVDVKRKATGGQAKGLLSAISELERGNITEAGRQLKILSGGGLKQDLESGKLIYVSFAANDSANRRKRPPWTSEYAHFYYAKALYLEGMKAKDPALLNQALLALVDTKIPDEQRMKNEKGKPTGPATTGGFLKRFDGGNSRFFAEAMLLKAKTLVGLKRYADAAKAFKDLDDKAVSIDIGPRWAYAAKLGAGAIAEAQGKYLDAENAYDEASNAMRRLLKYETRNCLRKELGRLHSRARMEAAAVMLQEAEKHKNPAAFRKLRNYIEESMPEALESRYAALPQAQKVPLVEGARDPEAQAVMNNGLGMAYFQEGKFEDAILRFRSVEVKYFQVPEEHARALHYLAQAAEKAAAQATGEAKSLYETYRDEAKARLKAEHPNSRWVR